MPRFYHPELTKTLTLGKDEGHHLAHVMRIGVGEHVEIVDGKGGLILAEVTLIRKETVELKLLRSEPKAAPLPSLTLVQAHLRLPRLEWLVEKATELGATRFLLYAGRWSEREELSEKQLDHLHRIAIAAMKQCGRLYLPAFESLPRLEEAKLHETLFYADPDPALPLLRTQKIEPPVALCIGPEKGFHPDEIAYLQRHGTGVRLHPWTLRAETAALCGLSVITNSVL